MRNGRQGREKLLDAEDAQRVRGIGLSAHVCERGAGLGSIRADDPGQAEAQPILAGENVSDPAIALRLVLLDPGQQRGRRGHMRLLAGERERLLGDRAFRPPLDHRAGAAVQRQDARAQRPAIAVKQIDAIAVRGRCDRFHVARRPTAQADRLGDRFSGGAPQSRHVALDKARMRHQLRNATTRHRQLRSVGVEDHRLRHRQAIVNSEQAGHGPSAIIFSFDATFIARGRHVKPSRAKVGRTGAAAPDSRAVSEEVPRE